MAQNTTDLKTATYITEAPGELAGLVGRRAEVLVAASAKPAAAKALGITLHRFNKEVEWFPGVDERLAELSEVAVWRSLDAAADDPWWYRNDEGIYVELSVDDDEPAEEQPDEDDGYNLLMDAHAPEGPQVLIASRHIDLEDGPEGEPETEEQTAARHAETEGERYCTEEEAEAQHDDGEWEDQEMRPPLCQYTEDGSRDFEDELTDTARELSVPVDLDELEREATEAEVQADRDTLADIDREAGMEPVPATAPEPLTETIDLTPPVITLTAEQAAEYREREARQEAHQDEMHLADDLELAVKLMAELNRQDVDDARKVIAREDSVQRGMWLTAARIARRHHTA